jgi:hypothetical protein
VSCAKELLVVEVEEALPAPAAPVALAQREAERAQPPRQRANDKRKRRAAQHERVRRVDVVRSVRSVCWNSAVDSLSAVQSVSAVHPTAMGFLYSLPGLFTSSPPDIDAESTAA